MMDKLMKAYVVKEVMQKVTKDASKMIRKQLKNFDTDKALHRIGLSTYRPGRASAASASLFLIGAAVGGLAALILAPKAGSELRADLKHRFAPQEEFNSTPASVRLETHPSARV
ncbi:MAG: YtxH domain-containing protein [Myxococcota bacterium]|nr:YtxH domain-containing protein [Myxococcota bacterium]